MNRRPWPLYLISFIFLVTACSMPFQAMWIYQIGFPFSLKMLTLLNWAAFATLIANAIIIPTGSRAIMLTVPMALIVVALNNSSVALHSQDFNPTQTHLATGAFFLVNSLLLHPKVLYLLKHPNKREWRVAHRFQRPIDLRVFPDCSDIFTATCFDISTTGIFIPLDDQHLKNICVGETLRIQLRFDSVFQMTVNAKVVRTNSASGKYPSGAGCKFETFDWKTKNTFSRLLEA